MFFIGLITEKKRENSILHMIKEEFPKWGKKTNLVIINESSISNIKNVKFDVIILDFPLLGKQEELKILLHNTKRILVNVDMVSLEILEKVQCIIISYGFHSKSTVTASSIKEEEIILCIQRGIKDITGSIIEPKEVKILKNNESVNNYNLMISLILQEIFAKSIKN